MITPTESVRVRTARSDFFFTEECVYRFYFISRRLRYTLNLWPFSLLAIALLLRSAYVFLGFLIIAVVDAYSLGLYVEHRRKIALDSQPTIQEIQGQRSQIPWSRIVSLDITGRRITVRIGSDIVRGTLEYPDDIETAKRLFKSKLQDRFHER